MSVAMLYLRKLVSDTSTGILHVPLLITLYLAKAKESNQTKALLHVLFTLNTWTILSGSRLSFKGGGLMGQVSQQCIVIGQDLHCLYRGFEIILGALNCSVEGGG